MESRKENSMESKKEYVVAYMDLLGTSSRIQSQSSEEALKSIKYIYEQSVKIFTGALAGEDIKVKIFSDKIILAKETTADASPIAPGVSQMICFAATFQMIAMLLDWPIRGGITVGELYIDDIIVWGRGLLRAYELENKMAISPRIVIDPQIIPPTMVRDNPDIIKHVKFDGGFLIVDYLSLIGDKRTAEDIRRVIMNLSRQANTNDFIKGKADWLRTDYHAWCEAHNFRDIMIQPEDVV